MRRHQTALEYDCHAAIGCIRVYFQNVTASLAEVQCVAVGRSDNVLGLDMQTFMTTDN